jgi:hypothetical protein
MNRTKLKKLFQLRIFHSYFENDTCPFVQLVPDEKTLELSNRFGFQLSTVAGHIGFFNSSGAPLDALLPYIIKFFQPVLRFTIISNDPQFGLYTELPANETNYDTISAANVLCEEELKLSGQPGQVAAGLKLGQLKVDIQDLLKFAAADNFARYCISYTARATRWQYYVIKRSQVATDSLVINGKTGVQFNGPDKVVAATGHPALLFTCADMLPLSEVPRYRFDLLSGKGSPMLKTLVKGLPTPDVEKLVRNEQQQFSSPMYVYV